MDLPAPALSPDARPGPTRGLAIATRVCAGAVIAVGVIALIGWVIDSEALRGFPTGITVKTNTAIAFVLAGVALLLLAAPTAGVVRVRVARSFAAIVLVIGLATLSEHVAGWNLGIDELLFHEPPGAIATASPNRMGPPASIGFVLVGAALLLFDRRAPVRGALAQALAIAVLLVALIPLLGYVLGVRGMYGIAHYTGIALATALAFLLLGIGLLLARPEAGVARRVFADDAGGIVLRRMLPAAVLVPIVLGWLRVYGERADFYSADYGRTLLVGLFVVVFVTVTWWTGGVVARHARARAEARVGELRARDQLVAALQTARENERQLSLALSAGRMGAWMRDLGDGAAHWSPQTERLLGLEPGSFSGKDDELLALVHPEDRQRLREELLAWPHRLDGATARLEYRIVRPDGAPIWIESIGQTLRDGPDGAPRQHGVALDVTERRQAERALRENEEWLRLAMEGARLGSFQYDLTARTLAATPRCRELFGFPPDRAPTPAELDARIHPDDIARVQAGWERCCTDGGRAEIEFRVAGPDGGWRWLHSTGHAIFDAQGRALRLLGVTMDVTQRKRAEEALHEANRQKDTFLAILAHELRNPLAPIRSAVAILQARGPLDTGMQWAHGVIERQVEHMARLLDDLLDISRITRGRLELHRRRVAVADVVLAALETSRPVLDAAGHDLRLTLPDEPLWLDADPLRIAQVVANLLNNAAKYTPRGGHVALAVERRGADLVLVVRDDGIGIAPEHLPRVFDMFAQAPGASGRSQGGLGIGLSLVRGIVEAHGGQVEARSAGPERGSEFTVRLALAQPPAAPAPAREHDGARARPSGLRLLLADDNADALDSLATLLELQGHDVHIARDGVEALEVAERVRPRAALLDIGMPGLNGYEVARRIRERPWASAVVLIALTGWGQEKDRSKAAEAGFDHHLVKPVDLADLAALLAGVAGPAAPRPQPPPFPAPESMP